MAEVGLLTPSAVQTSDATATLAAICEAAEKGDCVEVDVNVSGVGLRTGQLLPNGRFAYIA